MPRWLVNGFAVVGAVACVAGVGGTVAYYVYVYRNL